MPSGWSGPTCGIADERRREHGRTHRGAHRGTTGGQAPLVRCLSGHTGLPAGRPNTRVGLRHLRPPAGPAGHRPAGTAYGEPEAHTARRTVVTEAAPRGGGPAGAPGEGGARIVRG